MSVKAQNIAETTAEAKIFGPDYRSPYALAEMAIRVAILEVWIEVSTIMASMASSDEDLADIDARIVEMTDLGSKLQRTIEMNRT